MKTPFLYLCLAALLRHTCPSAMAEPQLPIGSPSQTPPAYHVLEHGALRVTIEVGGIKHEAEFGPRFDRTALVSSVTMDGRELVSRWGLCDEFGITGDGVLGYSEAGPGDPFIKIGFGWLSRIDAGGYNFDQRYPVRERLAIHTETGKGFVTVTQKSGAGRPWRYHYRKTYTLEATGVLRIDYTLSNHGDQPWSFEHYNHHWFLVEGQPPGRDYLLTTGFDLPEGGIGFIRKQRSLGFDGLIKEGDVAYLAGELDGVTAANNSFQLHVSGETVVSYRGDFSPARFAAFVDPRGFCGEVFFRARLAPGESTRWSARYLFVKK